MKDAAKRMQKLVEDILSLHRAGAKTAPFEPVDLDRVLREISVNFRMRLDEIGGKLKVGPLPTLVADESQLRRLFENLISNAYKFRKKEEPLNIRVSSALLQNGLVAISVEDNGIGFDPQFSERIFLPFERLNRRGEYEGSGLGLTSCSRIVRRHGGTISAAGRPGKGATITVTLPASLQRPY
jgi:signal transduction histidine kinase